MASFKAYSTVGAAMNAGSLYYDHPTKGKMLAVSKEKLASWKKKNKGKYKGSALTAWANAKGKNLKGPDQPTMSLTVKPKKKMPTTPEAKKKVVEGSKLKDNQKKMLLEQLEANEKRKAANAAKKKNLNKGGMMKKKGYAKGGMKKKGYAMGGMMPMNQKKKINPTTGLSMNRGGMTDMRKSGMFKGGMTKKK